MRGMYEAAPGVWLMEGVTLEENRAAWAGNYVPGEDEAFEAMAGEMFREATREITLRVLSDRDKNGQWKTQEGKILSYSDMGDSHLRNTYRMLERNGLRVHKHLPNLRAEVTRRGLGVD